MLYLFRAAMCVAVWNVGSCQCAQCVGQRYSPQLDCSIPRLIS